MQNIPESHLISTIEDNIISQEASNAISESTSKLRKRKAGRQEKILADLYLLTGFINQAQNSIDIAINATKLNKDYVWLASGLETKAAILLVKQHSMA